MLASHARARVRTDPVCVALQICHMLQLPHHNVTPQYHGPALEVMLFELSYSVLDNRLELSDNVRLVSPFGTKRATAPADAVDV